MQNRSFEDIYQAIEFCKKHFSDDEYIFRGQKKNWSLMSSFFRRSGVERRDLLLNTDRFCGWVKENPVLQPFNKSLDSILAISQHYSSEFGFVTDLIDFTRDIDVAGFFAASEKSDSQEQGVIYVTSISWFESIYNKYTELEKEQYTKYDEYIPPAFYIPELPQMGGFWRLESQKGLFMRDYHGLVSQWPDVAIEFKLMFKHNEGKTIKDFYPEINEQLVWPPRNELEWEIERYKSIRVQGRSLPKSISKYFTPIHVEKDTEFEEFQNQAPLLDWHTGAEKWLILNQASLEDVPKIMCVIEDETVASNQHRSSDQMETEKEKIVLAFTRDNAEVGSSISPEYLHTIHFLRQKALWSSGPTIVVYVEIGRKIKAELGPQTKPLLELLQRALKELLDMTLYYPYSDTQIAKATLNLFALALHSQNTPAGVAGVTAIMNAFKERIIMEIEFVDKSHIEMAGYAPVSFFNRIESMTKLRNCFNQNYPKYHLDNNLQLIQFFTDIRKLITLSDVVEIWSSIMLPWQLLFQAPHTRIINPYYLEIIGRA